MPFNTRRSSARGTGLLEMWLDQAPLEVGQIVSAVADGELGSLRNAKGVMSRLQTASTRVGAHMWPFAVALASTVPAEQQDLAFDGEIFGTQRTLTCTWFTNFENSRFEQCQDATGKLLQDGDGASIKCVPARMLNWTQRPAQAGRKGLNFNMGNVQGGAGRRVSRNSHEKRYLGDSTRTVLW
jgi:hypothetical protein